MSINAILAIDNNYGIGYGNNLPWPVNRKDMKWFRDNTRGHVVVMGRKPWERLGSVPLPHRINVVVSSRELEGPDVVMGGDLPTILQQLENRFLHLHIFVIGGAEIYRQAMPFCDKLYVTRLNKSYRCDTFMRQSDFEDFEVCEYEDKDDEMTIQIRSKS